MANVNLVDALVGRESSGKTSAISYRRGKPLARGLMQVTEPALKDWNKYVGKGRSGLTYSMQDMHNPTFGKRVGEWYLLKRIPDMLKAFGVPVTPYNVVWAYHDGAGNVKNGYKSPIVKGGYVSDILGKEGKGDKVKSVSSVAKAIKPSPPKDESRASRYRKAFAKARKVGKKVFRFEGELYNTKYKGE